MAGLFSSPHAYDSDYREATVTNIDPIRFVCSVRTVRGQFFSDVAWLLPSGGSGKSGMHLAPNIGDQVIICTSLGYPIILGALPRIGTPSTELNSVSGSSLGADAGNSSNLKNGYSGNPNKPADFAPGDYGITSEGGGGFSLMANGSASLKASPLSQIFLSKFDDIVRVIARNWERFSDSGQHTAANIAGRTYEFFGWDRSVSKSKNSIYELTDIIGDVAAGEVHKGDPSPDISSPAKDSRIRKYALDNKMVEVLTDDGKVVVTVNNGGVATKVHDNSLVQTTVTNGTTSTLTVTQSTLILDYNGIATITINPDSIITSYNNSAVTVHSDAGITHDFSGHFVHVTSGGVQLG